jgi:fibronectin type 3 domain-containing protein
VGLSLATILADSGTTKINTLSWYDNPSNAAITLLSYKIYRKPADAADSQFALIATVSPQTHAYQDANLPLSTKFTYSMTAAGKTGGDSDSSEYVTENEVFPPLAAAVTSIVNSSLFKKELLNVVSWQDNPLNGPVSVVRYNIYRKSSGQDDSQYKKIAWVLGSEFEYRDRKLSASDSFVYRITALDANGTESAPALAALK